MRGGDIIGIIAMLAGSGVAILFLDWIDRNKAEALGQETGLETFVPEGMRTAAEGAGGGERSKEQRSSVTSAHFVPNRTADGGLNNR